MKESQSGVLFVEIYVGMGKMVAWWHRYALGFEWIGTRERKGQYGMEITYWLRKGNANLLITSAMEPTAYDVVSFIDKHGNSIKRFAVEIHDAEQTLDRLRNNKAVLVNNGIEQVSDKEETAKLIRCKLFDDNELVFIERKNCDGPMPGFVLRSEKTEDSSNSNIIGIDHLASVVRMNESDYWNDYLCRLLNMSCVQTIGEEFFANLLTGMKMQVLHSEEFSINKVIVEPLPDKARKSQVDVFLQHHFGTGIQHLAFEVKDLIQVVKEYKSKGINFTPVPERYYKDLKEEFPELPVDMMQQSNILCEKDGDKLLLQVFTEPVGDRPTLFYEFVQRVNAYDGFGANNVRQLFRSLEQQLNANT